VPKNKNPNIRIDIFTARNSNYLKPKNSGVDYQSDFPKAASFLTGRHAFMTFRAQLGKTPKYAKRAKNKACRTKSCKP
jgi:hypothetical protein